MSALRPVIRTVEERLARYYGFSPLATAEAHLVTRNELVHTLGDDVRAQPEWLARAGVWLVDEGRGPNELFIGLHLSEELQDRLAQHDPTAQLSDVNLDAFCVLVEELSHFHLILNRASAGRQVSKLELEWQGEIDKLLVCALVLQEQAGDPHLLPLARKLFDASTITASEELDRYWEATRYAARFWFDVVRDSDLLEGKVRDSLIRAYHASWPQKVASLEASRLPKAS